MVDVDFLNRCDFFTNYTFQNPEFIDGNNNGKRIPMTAQHQANLGMNLEFLKNFGVSLTGHYVGSRYPINDTENITAGIKPYFTMDSKLTYKAKYCEFFVKLNNIFNEQYYNYAAKKPAPSIDKDHYPAPDRNFLIGVTGKF